VRRSIALLAALLVVVGVAAPAGAEVTQAQLREAKATMNAKAAALATQLDRLDAILRQQAAYESRIAALQDQITDRTREIVLSEAAAREQARAMYVGGGGSVATAATPESITETDTRNAYLQVVVNSDADAVNRLVFLQDDQQTLQQELSGLLTEQQGLADEATALSDEMQQALTEANDEYQALYSQWQKEEAARIAKARAAAAAAAAAAAGRYNGVIDATGRACPVAGPTYFRDSWGEPRPGGREHHGTDMMAAEGTPLVAIENGYIWSMGYNYLGGNGLYIKGDSGDVYYYAHLQKYYPGIHTGMRVAVTQYVGYVGHTGDATAPHLHLGWYPGGYENGIKDPYPLVVKLCR
jgi:murein DD-endopeptidase MepM/ murein hydrolase activator NlpD